MQNFTQDDLAWNFYRNPRQPYDEFITNYILKPLKFEYVRKHYDRPLTKFVDDILESTHHFSTVHGPGGEAWLAEIVSQIEAMGIHNVYRFLDQVTTRTQAQVFLQRSGIPQPSLMEWLDYLKQWWFPFPATLRQLVDDDGDPNLNAVLAQLKTRKISNSNTLLEAAAEPAGRQELAQQVGINPLDLLDLVHRADVSRLPYTSGGAVKRLWVMGYRSLADLRSADPQEYASRIEAYFTAGGKGSSFDAKMSTILGFLMDARHAPEVVEVG